jgi:hypothetical protein
MGLLRHHTVDIPLVVKERAYEKSVAVTIERSVLLLVVRPDAVSADAVTAWNENVAKAAIAAAV